MKQKAKKFLSVLLCMAMVLSIFTNAPLTGFAAEKSSDGFTTMSLIYSKESTLAPGVTQYENAVYAADGRLINYYYAVADLSNEYVGIHTSYKDAQCAIAGMAKMTDQAVSLEALHSNLEDEENYIANYAVVAGVNADGYNTGSGVPSGIHVANWVYGFNKTAPAAKKDPWFGLFADGTALCGSTLEEWNTAIATHGQPKEAIGGFQLVMKDGVEIPFGTEAAGSDYLDTGRYPRSFIGVTADNKIVMMAVDGNGAGGSAGTNYAESVEILKQAGCTDILCLDGGGSATYISRPAGSNTVQVVNTPSDGSERAVSNGIVIYSTVPASDTFDHSIITAEYDYVTPGSAVKFSAIGVSPAGTAAEIPEEATYSATFGTVTEDGVFTSDGTVGDAVISMMLDGEVVGSTTIHVVYPTVIKFNRASLVVPYEESIILEYTATYGVNTVKMQDDDVVFTLADKAIGTIEGNKFTAAAVDLATTVTVKLVADETVYHTIPIKLGKASDVIMNFEEGDAGADLTKWGLADQADGKHIHTILSIVTPETGMVHSGNQALAFNYKMDEGIHGTEFWAGNGLRWMGDSIELKNATGLGFWLYVPEDAVQLGMFVNLFTHGENGKMNGRVLDESSEYTDDDLGYSGWRYIYMPLAGGTYYIEDNAAYVGQSFNGSAFKYKANKFIGFYAVNIDAWKDDLTNFAGDFTFYIDDITVDYSDAVNDRELPIFSDMTYAVAGMSDAAALNGQTVDSHIVSLAGKVEDDMTKDNATGLNDSTAVAYIDGEAVACTFENGVISIDDYYLADGTHTIRMGICDKQGNYAEIRRQITVDTDDNENTVYVVPQDPELEYMLNGSVYWIDIKADAVETVETVTVKLDLDSMNNWELDYMTVLSGFACEWKFATANDKAENIVTLTFTRDGYVSATGTATLASLPIRVWDYVASDDHKHNNAVEAWKCNYVCAPALSVDVETEYGVVEYLDGTSHTFSAPDIRTYCVSYTYGVYLKDYCSDYYKSHSYHVHSAEAIADKDATCTEYGYTGRTWCTKCNSPVVWGTVVDAKGHNFVITDGVLKCECGELFNGVHTDGKTYTDGVVNAGWIGDSYYVDGIALTGVQFVEGFYYDFGEAGVCANKTKYTGKFYNEAVEGYCYAISGELQRGWYLVDGIWNYFRWTEKTAVTGTYTFASGNCAGITYVFDDEGNLTDGVWHTREDGNVQYFYGPDCYKWANNMLQEIDGKTYCFDKDGYLYRGWQIVKVGAFAQQQLYHFDEVTGEFIKIYDKETGIFPVDGGNYCYLVDGAIQRGLGMVTVDGSQYYVRSNGLLAVGKFYIGAGYTGCGHLTPGYYDFGEDGKFAGPWIDENAFTGVKADDNGNLHYYVNDAIQYGLGMITIDGSQYYVRGNGLLAVGRYYIGAGYTGCSHLTPGYYNFGEDGKYIGPWVDEDAFTGVKADAQGKLRYYVNDVVQYGLGLITVGDAQYYVRGNGYVAVGKYYIGAGYTGCEHLTPGGFIKRSSAKKNSQRVFPASNVLFRCNYRLPINLL